jgi:hypothetical protein
VLYSWKKYKIFGPKKEEMAGGWVKLIMRSFIIVWCSPNIIRVRESRRIRWAGHVACMGEMRSAYKILV